MSRDARLDVWRGLCLVDVVLVHLAFAGLGFPAPLDDAIKHYTRFAAGGFVFLAGLTIGVAFWPNVLRSAASRARVYQWLWRRAALLVSIEVLASLAFRLLDPLRWFPSDPDTPAGEALLAILSFQRPGVMGGILILYAIVLGALPAVFELRRRAGDWPVAALSLLLYLVAWSSGGLTWPRGEFPVAYWQPIFFAGLFAASAWRWIQAGGHRRAVGWAAAATLAFAGVFAVQHGPAFGIEGPARLLALDFAKVPLQPGALLWYLAIVQVVLAWTHLVWERFFAGTQVTAWLALLGRHSLLFYAAHVFTEIPVLEWVWQHWPPAYARLALAGADLAVLTALCAAAEGGLPALRAAPWPRLARSGAALGLATAVATLVVVREPAELEITAVDQVQSIGDAGDGGFSADPDEPGASFEPEPDVTLG